MQQKPSSRRQQLLRQLSSVSGYKGIDSLSDLTIREQIEWILQRTNPRLRLAIATLVHAGERSSCSAPDPTRNPPTGKKGHVPVLGPTAATRYTAEPRPFRPGV